jgi:hypothetical protein
VEIRAMVSATNVMRSGYYLAKMLPVLLWTPISMRSHSRRATDVFEKELLESGLEAAVAHQLAEAFSKGNKGVIKKLTSLRTWT